MTTQKNKDLKKFVDTVADKSHLRVESDLGDGFFRLRATEAQRRQAKQDIRNVEDIIIEILRNSRDANSKNIYLATHTENNFRHLLIIDDGNGVPKSHHEIIFEPYVTSKLNSVISDVWGVHGRGMALYSIKENCDEAKVVNSNSGLGCSILIKSNTNKLPEKRDQSTFPDFFINDDSELLIRGPKNILRTCCEFAVENRDVVNVFVGSPVEIAATLYRKSIKQSNIKSIFNEPGKDTKLVDLLGYSSDVHDFKNYASKLGISLSKRTARRIMDNEILPQSSILERISKKGIKKSSGSSAMTGKSSSEKSSSVYDIFNVKGLHSTSQKKSKIIISKDDKEVLKRAVIESFGDIADKYYLSKDIDPYIKVTNDKVSITFSVLEL